MPVFKKQVEQGPVVEPVKVHVQVREEGHGKISTGKHHGRDGEQCYATGETFSVNEDTAKELKARYYVDIVPAPVPVPKAR